MSLNFVQAVMGSEYKAPMGLTTTENGELAYASTQPPPAAPAGAEQVSGRLDFFYQSVRGITEPELHALLARAHGEDPVDALRLCYVLRCCRDDAPAGKGERELFRMCARWWLASGNEQLWNDNLRFVPLMGRADDLLHAGPQGVKMFADQLRADLESERPSLFSKWAPSAKGSESRKRLRRELCAALGDDFNEARYRKEIIRPLRKKLHIVEEKMCAQQWTEIPYAAVPSKCMVKNKSAFRKHDETGFQAYFDSLKRGEKKAKVAGVMPHELVASLSSSAADNAMVEEQWRQFIAKQRERNGALMNALCICDVSGSMHGQPIQVAMALSLVASELAAEPFKHCIVPFSQKAEFVNLAADADSLERRVRRLHSMRWEMNTDIGAVLRLILDTATKHQVAADDMPKKLFIFSDMQFDVCVQGLTTIESFAVMYHRYGYTMPEIVFWNLRSSKSFPARADDVGITLVSGFDASMFKMVTNTEDLEQVSPWTVLRNLLDDPYYSRIGRGGDEDVEMTPAVAEVTAALERQETEVVDWEMVEEEE